MNILDQVKQLLKDEIENAAVKAELAKKEELPEVVLEVPKDKAHGDFATNMAMQLARIAKKAPRAIADELVANFDKSKASIAKVEIAGPGFINFYMDNAYLTDLVPTVIKADKDYGRTEHGGNKKIQVEFVSANPTGTLHLGHARGAAVGDSICNILDFAGYEVSREFYINDAGNQINNMAFSIEARYLQALGQDKGNAGRRLPRSGYYSVR